MNNGGWIRLHRRLRDHWLWKEERRSFTKAQAWIDLLLSANHSPSKVLIGSILMEIGRGQLLTSKVALAKKWRWNRKTVDTFLRLAEKDEILSFESSRALDTGHTLISIRNYSKYQDSDNAAWDIGTDIGKDIHGTSKGH